jgi:alpha-amylase/alpha-mannosidase (GH57 family)
VRKVKDKYLCIHGHFYQPPRENPWLEAVEYQASASPYHDWNERITRECYGPNTRARLHDENGHILKLTNNYAYMSFDFGPTLLSWLEKAHPWIYGQIITADRLSRERFQGHGNALAQVYNHIIMPLATRRDKLTQIRWGLADFKHRFGREAEGMWLAETAVNTETLELMTQEGVKFTVLSPTQAQSVRPLKGPAKDKAWQDVTGGGINPTRPYRVRLGNRGERFIDVFFYDGPVSRAVAYEKLLGSGEDFLARIEQAFGTHKDGPQLVSLATDGESYGHHFKFGDLALSWLFNHVEQSEQMNLTNYGLFLESFPPEYEVRIIENSSWSCAHGVKRWCADCGCSVCQEPGWNQAWRAPLREGLDWLAGKLAGIFEERAGLYFKDPRKAKDEYINVFLSPLAGKREIFLKDFAVRPLEHEEQVEAFQLMESQRMALYMFTSCGWFFDDISGLEPVQILKYAARAMELVEPWAGKELEAGLIKFLSGATSNDPDYRDGKYVYETRVRPSRIDPSLAAAHHAFTGLIQGTPGEKGLFSEMVRPLTEQRLTKAAIRAISGEAQVVEIGTGREHKRIYLAMCGKGGKMSCLVGERADKILPVLTMDNLDKAEETFSLHVAGVKRYGLKDLIPDVRKSIMEGLAVDVDITTGDYVRKYNGFLEEFLSLPVNNKESGLEIPKNIMSILLTDEMERFFASNQEKRTTEMTRLHDLAAQAGSLKLILNEHRIRHMAQDYLRRQMNRLALDPDRISMENIISFLNLADELNLKPDLWKSQNMFYDLYCNPEFTDNLAPEVSSGFYELGRRLGFLMEETPLS